MFQHIRKIVLGALLIVSYSAQADFSGEVVLVFDGNTVDVSVRKRLVRVRLAQIDAPEIQQAFGRASRQALSNLVLGKRVAVQEIGTDQYGRVLGTLYIDDMDINREMVRLGMAWVYRQYMTDPTLFISEREARDAHRGLWADRSAIPPWAFRKKQYHHRGRY